MSPQVDHPLVHIQKDVIRIIMPWINPSFIPFEMRRPPPLLSTLSSWQRRLIIWCEPIIRVDTSERRHHPQPHPLADALPRKLTGSAVSLTVHLI